MNKAIDTRNPEEQPEEKASSARTEGENPKKDKKPKQEYEIDIFKGWCKCCGICAAFCPRECIRLDEEGSPIVESSARCTGCGWCEIHCPDFAISVRTRKSKKTEEETD